ncbi:MAG TPA: MoxR family ATPase [Pyrinomonadaceae bacterium]|jgi:MoxR-like ATPase|nr:MoxR family ATPase [Pyrinomonadaceae bacterium]
MQLINENERAAALDSLQESVAQLESEIANVIVGQREVVRQLMVAVASGGHCLLRGVPGLAKTLLVKTLAEALTLRFNRIQFTPDLMPSDITGTEVIEEDRATGRREGRFISGPIFANIVLADEINRAPPKTQAALLEAMQENQVTAGGIRYTLDRPFFVLATENPIEQEGTYHLPEAQLDRFLFEIVINYPQADEERRIIAQTTANRTTTVRPVLDGAQLLRIQEVVRDVPAASNIIDFAARLVRASRPGTVEAAPFAEEHVRWGAGPRAGQALILGAKANALLEGRFAVGFDDVRKVAYPVLRHRILPNFRAEAEGIGAETIISELLRATPVDAS